MHISQSCTFTSVAHLAVAASLSAWMRFASVSFWCSMSVSTWSLAACGKLSAGSLRGSRRCSNYVLLCQRGGECTDSIAFKTECDWMKHDWLIDWSKQLRCDSMRQLRGLLQRARKKSTLRRTKPSFSFAAQLKRLGSPYFSNATLLECLQKWSIV
jgi:hypothetical protein